MDVIPQAAYLGNVLLPSAWPPETEEEVLLQPLTAVLERRSAVGGCRVGVG